MKKAILILAALMLVASGVAAVSAYEAHVVNVKATVENALSVSTNETDFGVVFPEEWLDRHFTVNFSDSWGDQSRVDTVNFTVWAEWKPLNDGYYPWLGDAMYIEVGPSQGYIGPNITAPGGCQPALDASGDPMQALLGAGAPGSITSIPVHVWIDVPVFEDFYNPCTDVPDKPRAAWADTLAGLDPGEPSMILPSGTPQGYEMGVDLKIQVVDIWTSGT